MVPVPTHVGARGVCVLLIAALLGGCWGGPDVKPLEIVTVEPPPQFGPIGPPGEVVLLERVSQTDLSLFFSQYEDSDTIPAEVLERYLTDPALMAIQTAMISDLIEHVQNGGAPLAPDEFYQLALGYTNDPGTALILCHNVLKAMARGRSPIPWEKQSEQPLVYLFDGQAVDGAALPLHPDAATTGSRSQPSLFYRFFSPTALGRYDEGDWYHYFLEAAAAYYGATSRADTGGPGFGLDYYHVVGGAVDDTINQMRDSAYADTPAYHGWRWANALSFLEEAYYGTDYAGTQEEAGREARDHMRGAIFGLSLAGYLAEWPRRHGIRLAGAGVALLVLVGSAACTGPAGSAPTETPGVSLIPDAPHIEPATLDQLFGSAGLYLQISGELEVITFRCTVVEGTFCWFGQRTQEGAVAGGLARTMVDQIGPQAIENANRNEVAVQCYRPTSGGDPYCEIDWGWGAGWEALPLN